MRKAHKQELQALLDTMGKMANVLPKSAEPSVPIQDLLAACQCVRENLELDDAPKSLYLLQTIETSLKENKLDIVEHIKNLKGTFNSEIKIKLEVAFLPYKASMWDSLESIYLAAKDDPDCDAFVVPIPYYDKKNGMFAEMHWETDYPKNIPLVDFRKYNIEERHPDIIFIHNPYDDCNMVTSVTPEFYSKKLRGLTDCLVYVPYFVGDGINVQEHFCTTPGCIYAHKVITQTEEERKIYIRTYKEFAKKYKVSESIDKIGSKFLVLGSPKLDKVVSAKSEDYEIPEEWKKLINKEGSTRKKVVFYNTSIGALLQYSVENSKPSNKYLQKIRDVFEFFKNQNDVVLLWRPHPLWETTIKSMRPWLEQEYTEIVNEYKASGYGIYDDSQDLNRAVALSDIYYGDESSVTKLFETAGKPVIGQMFEMPIAYGLYDDGAYIWFADRYNIIYRYDKQNKKNECMGMVFGQKSGGYTGIAAGSKKMYFAPYVANEISVFDIDKKCFEQLYFKDNLKYNRNFHNIYCFKNFIYFAPSDYPAIMRLDTDTNEIEYFSQWLDEAFKLKTSKLQGFENIIFGNSCTAGEEIVMIINGANAVMFLNMETGSYEIKKIGERSEQYNDICFDGQDYYLCPFYENYIIKWNRGTDKVLKIKFPTSFSRRENKRCNYLIQYLNGYIWLFPLAANNAYKIDMDTNEITETLEFTEFFGDKKLSLYYNSVTVGENFIYASTINKGIVEYNTNTSELNLIRTDIDTELLLSSCLHDYDKCENKINKTLPKNEIFGKKIWEHTKGWLK